MSSNRFLPALVLLGLVFAFPALAREALVLEVDATAASRGLQSVRMQIPVSPGPVTLVYPKWIPGNHRPSGTINSLSGLVVRAGDAVLGWERDPLEMFAFRVEVPPGVARIDVAFDLIGSLGAQAPTADRRATDALAVLQWNRLLLYPAGIPVWDIPVEAAIRLPSGWTQASALPGAVAAGDRVRFATVSLETLVDSPVLIGRHMRAYPLGGEPAVTLHAAADSAAALAISPQAEVALRRLVVEARALFGAEHYDSYHFLLSLSDQADGYGLEHHASSDNWAGERSLVDEVAWRGMATLLSHEYTHSWNGKYRRPAGLVAPDFQQPVQPDLLWVYEGLTEYLQGVLAARSGLLSATEYQEDWAYAAAEMALRRGREWRPLADTARAVQIMRGQPQDWVSRRRGVDYYTEGALLWLEADVLIRRESRGRRSLDDFCRRFFGGESGPPRVLPYTLDDMLAALQAVQPHDWAGFWRERLSRVRTEAPLEGLVAAGWQLAWGEEPTSMQTAYDTVSKRIDLRHSLGFSLGEADSIISDIVPGSPADAVGMAPGSVLLGVDGRKWSSTLIRDALRAGASGKSQLELLVQNQDVFRTLTLSLSGGARYPRLERIKGSRDLLATIAKPLGGAP
jgi:predicted metalloprotease with PDZ domain